MKKRPISVTLIAVAYLMVGTIGFVVHLREALARPAFQYDDVLIELTELIAITCGAFLLRGRNWARWLAVAWITFHVAISFFDSWQKVVIHGLILLLIAYCLFRPKVGAYFAADGRRAF